MFFFSNYLLFNASSSEFFLSFRRFYMRELLYNRPLPSQCISSFTYTLTPCFCIAISVLSRVSRKCHFCWHSPFFFLSQRTSPQFASNSQSCDSNCFFALYVHPNAAYPYAGMPRNKIINMRSWQITECGDVL